MRIPFVVMVMVIAVDVNIPLLVRGQALDVLRVAVSCAGDSPHGRGCRHPPGRATCSRRHLNAEIREDPDHPRAWEWSGRRVRVRV